MQIDGEDDDQDDGQPEVGNGDGGAGAERDRPVNEAAGMGAGDDAGGHAQQDHEDQRAQRQAQGDREPLLDLRRHRAVGVQGSPKIAARRVAQPRPVLGVDRTVELELVAHLGDLRFGGVHPSGQGAGRIARHDERHGEDEERDNQQQGDQCQQPACDVPDHGTPVRRLPLTFTLSR